VVNVTLPADFLAPTSKAVVSENIKEKSNANLKHQMFKLNVQQS
jgi:hypothetical protein